MNIFPRRHALLAVHSDDPGPELGRLVQNGRARWALMSEVELKLTADLADLPRIRRASLEMAGGVRAPRMTLVSTYYDTADRRLARRRLVLRVRRQGRHYIQAVKSQDLSGAAAATRGEWEDVIAGERPDLSAPNSAEHLPEAIDEHKLCALFSTEIRRAVIPIRLA
jgi:triphosphatase